MKAGSTNKHLTDIQDLARIAGKLGHDVRGPLNSILGFSQLLRQGPPGQMSSQQLEFLDVIIRNGHRLLSIVDSVACVSNLISGRWQPYARAVGAGIFLKTIIEEVERSTPAGGTIDAVALVEEAKLDPDMAVRVLSEYLVLITRGAPANWHLDLTLDEREGGVLVTMKTTEQRVAEAMERLASIDSLDERVSNEVGGGLRSAREMLMIHGGFMEFRRQDAQAVLDFWFDSRLGADQMLGSAEHAVNGGAAHA